MSKAKSLKLLVGLALVACGPTPVHVDHRGEAGNYCRPDGTCISSNLECVDSAIFLGLPLDATPSCRVKAKR